MEVTSEDDSEDLPQLILAQMFAFVSSDTNLEARTSLRGECYCLDIENDISHQRDAL